MHHFCLIFAVIGAFFVHVNAIVVESLTSISMNAILFVALRLKAAQQQTVGDFTF